jgi:hypothetical protein
MSRRPRSSLDDLDRYLKMRPAEIKRALDRAAEAEERRTGVFHKYRIPDPFERLKLEIASAICDGRTGQLKEWARELVEGDARDLAVAILTIACSQLSIVLNVAVPFAALLAKRGLKGICKALRPQKSRRNREQR